MSTIIKENVIHTHAGRVRVAVVETYPHTYVVTCNGDEIGHPCPTAPDLVIKPGDTWSSEGYAIAFEEQHAANHLARHVGGGVHLVRHGELVCSPLGHIYAPTADRTKDPELVTCHGCALILIAEKVQP